MSVEQKAPVHRESLLHTAFDPLSVPEMESLKESWGFVASRFESIVKLGLTLGLQSNDCISSVI